MKFLSLQKITILTLTALLISGCGSTGSSKAEYLQDANSKASPKQVENNLTRTALWFAHGKISAYPITGSYLSSEWNDKGYKEGLSQAQIQNEINLEKQQIGDRSCFMVKVNSDISSDVVNLRYWGATAKQANRYYKMKFVSPTEGHSFSHQEVYATTMPSSQAGGQPRVTVNTTTVTNHVNSDIVCTLEGEKINYLQPFELQFKPRMEKTSKIIKLIWEGPK